MAAITTAAALAHTGETVAPSQCFAALAIFDAVRTSLLLFPASIHVRITLMDTLFYIIKHDPWDM
jgi:hypothetical protein